MIKTVAVLLGIIFTCVLPAPAGAHYKTGNPDESASDWYFRGGTIQNGVKTDPINFIFYGGSKDTTAYTRERIQTHMVDDWDIAKVGGRRWHSDNEMIRLCKQDQRVQWLGYPGETSDKSDWHGATLSTGGICGNQHHARFWDDLEHKRQNPEHGDFGQWVVGGIHHEKVVRKRPGCCVAHVPDRDWDSVRLEMIRALYKHCSVRRWKYHPGADFSRVFENSGYIARFSLHHRSDGGCDGY